MLHSVPSSSLTARLRRAAVLIFLSATSLVLTPVRSGAQPPRPMTWKPVTPADLAVTAPVVDPKADAEALLWEVRVFDELQSSSDDPQTVFEHYLRVKIFTERGKDDHSTVDLPYTSDVEINNVAARTIAPDGTITELKRSDIYQRTVVKTNDIKVKAVSFAVPAIAVGSIVEYHWREVHRDSVAMNLVLPFSRDIPVQLVRYYIRPLPDTGDYKLMAQPFNAQFSPLEPQRDGFSMTTLTNVPAQRDEPYPVPELETQPWLLLSYTDNLSETVVDYWTRIAKVLWDVYAERTKGSDELRRAAQDAVKGLTDPREQVAALVRATQARVVRVDLPSTPPELARAAKNNKTAGDAFKRGQGTARDQLVVFLAMAKAVGLDARPAVAGNRSLLFFKFDRLMAHMAREHIAAVNLAGAWHFVEPSNRMSTSGELLWFQEWEPVMVLDPKKPIMTRTPLTPASATVRRRTATLKLSEDGTLEGDVEVAYTGHYGQRMKRDDEQDTVEERTASVREAYTRRMPGAEISDVVVENVTDPAKPYINRFKLRVPGFAQKTGSRMFVQLAALQKGIEPVFASEMRTQDVYFPHGWTEEDALSIALPDGWRIEAPTRPAAVNGGVGRHQIALDSTDAWRTLQIKRTFVYGLTDALVVTRATYPVLKKFFDLVQQKDAHTVVLLKREPAQ
jgi:transglutaminase-like putative cysteine protease